MNPLSLADYIRFRNWFYEKTGIYFDETKRYFVDKRVHERFVQTDCPSMTDYMDLLNHPSGSKEVQVIINTLTVNETYFFREAYQFQCMTRALLGEITQHKRTGERIRIWSVPSSTGEEAYSIALQLLEVWVDIHRWDVELISSDIDTEVLIKARSAKYSPRSVQHVPFWMLQKYFIRDHEGEYQLSDEIRSVVKFTHLNLVSDEETKTYRNFDLVFCRNLLIYFDDHSRKAAAKNLYDALNPGGFLCLGHSESLNRLEPRFLTRRFSDGIIYQKPYENGQQRSKK